jgi:hypothetical protein
MPAFPSLDVTDSSLVIKEGYLYVEAPPHYDFSKYKSRSWLGPLGVKANLAINRLA